MSIIMVPGVVISEVAKSILQKQIYTARTGPDTTAGDNSQVSYRQDRIRASVHGPNGHPSFPEPRSEKRFRYTILRLKGTAVIKKT
jgi:hypothetical protein